MTTTQLKKQIATYIDHFDDDQLEAILKVAQVLDKDIPDYTLTEKEWEETEKNFAEMKNGTVKGIPADKALNELKTGK
jgi:hypothetical protein